MTQQEQPQPDIIYVCRKTGKLVGEGYPNSEAYIRLVDAQPKLEPDTTRDYESINLASALQRKLSEEHDSISVWRRQISDHLQEHKDNLDVNTTANFKTVYHHLRTAMENIESGHRILDKIEEYLAKH